MALLVEVTNITDAPGKHPKQIDIYRKTLDPGDVVKIPADLITPQVKALEKEGLITIGQVPSWYTAYKLKHFGQELTPEEIRERLTTKVVPDKTEEVVEVPQIKETKKR